MSLANLLPEEPDTTCVEPVSLLRIRCPDGRILNRRFLASEPLRVLIMYVGSVGFEANTYKLLTTFPRKDVSASVLFLLFVVGLLNADECLWHWDSPYSQEVLDLILTIPLLLASHSYIYASVIKQHNLVLVKGQLCSGSIIPGRK